MRLMVHKDTFYVYAANAIAVMTWAQVNQALTTVSLLLAISFTIYKFVKNKE